MADLSPAQAWDTLTEGQARFASDAPLHPRADAARRADLASGQAPFAAVLGCSDSRVSPELVFDTGLGDLFTVRTAGQVVDDATLGSLEYGVAALGVPLLVVLGHTSCGAVTAAREALHGAPEQPGHIADVVASLLPTIETGEAQGAHEVDELVDVNVRLLLDSLPARSGIIRDAMDAGHLALVGATYRLGEGALTVHEARGPLTLPSTT